MVVCVTIYVTMMKNANNQRNYSHRIGSPVFYQPFNQPVDGVGNTLEFLEPLLLFFFNLNLVRWQ